jgi:hypothetical protein
MTVIGVHINMPHKQWYDYTQAIHTFDAAVRFADMSVTFGG